MKRLILMILSAVFIISSCSINKDTSKGKIEVLSPMTLSSSSIGDKTIRIKMTEGTYYEDWNPGAIMGTIWEGKFVIEVISADEKVINQVKLSDIHAGEDNKFTRHFDIHYNDYNNDGDMDFTIGQYANSNGYDYKIYTLRTDGRIEELKVEGYPLLYIGNGIGAYSTLLTVVDELTFSKTYYDNTKAKYFEDYFSWDGKRFVYIKTNEL